MPKQYCTASTRTHTKCKNYCQQQEENNYAKSFCAIHLRYPPPPSISSPSSVMKIEAQNESETKKRRLTSHIRGNPLRKQFISLRQQLASLAKEVKEHKDQNSLRQWVEVEKKYQTFAKILRNFIQWNMYSKRFQREFKKRWQEYMPKSVPQPHLSSMITATLLLGPEHSLKHRMVVLEKDKMTQEEVGDFIWYVFSKNPDWVVFVHNLQRRVRTRNEDPMDIRQDYLLEEEN